MIVMVSPTIAVAALSSDRPQTRGVQGGQLQVRMVIMPQESICGVRSMMAFVIWTAAVVIALSEIGSATAAQNAPPLA
jgi:hypothetical protein